MRRIASVILLFGAWTVSAQVAVKIAAPIAAYADPLDMSFTPPNQSAPPLITAQVMQPAAYAMQPGYAPPPAYTAPRGYAAQQNVAPQYAPQSAPQPQYAPPARSGGPLGGGFLEALFGGASRAATPQSYQPATPAYQGQQYGSPSQAPGYAPSSQGDMANYQMDPQFQRQEVAYQGSEKPGTIVIDTPNKFLYLVEDDGRALRYGIGVGRPGFTWAGVKTISAKREWPDWRPPAEMLARRPDLPRYMPGGVDNPLGARAMYLGSTLYRIHGSNEPWTIGTNVSSGCIRMRNEDVTDLYGRVKVGTKVVVI